MVAYNFKAQFAPLIKSGQKLQTIRALGKRRPPMPGEPLQLYTGMRTKQCQKLLDPDPLCVSVEPVKIHILSGHEVTVGERRLTKFDELTNFAAADGFESAQAFFDFFQNTHGLPFEGILITWRLLLVEPEPAGQGKDPSRIQLPLEVA